MKLKDEALNEEKTDELHKIGTIASSLIGRASARVRAVSRVLLVGWDGRGASTIEAANAKTKLAAGVLLGSDLVGKVVANLQLYADAVGSKIRSVALVLMGGVEQKSHTSEIRCVESHSEAASEKITFFATKGQVKQPCPEFLAADAATSSINNVTSGSRSETYIPVAWNLAAMPEPYSKWQSERNKVVAKLDPLVASFETEHSSSNLTCSGKSEYSRQKSNQVSSGVVAAISPDYLPTDSLQDMSSTQLDLQSNLEVNSQREMESSKESSFIRTSRKNTSAAKSVCDFYSSIPHELGGKIINPLQNLTFQEQGATNRHTINLGSTNHSGQVSNYDSVSGIAEVGTGEMQSINTNQNEWVESKSKSLLAVEQTMLRALSTQPTKQPAAVPVTNTQTLELKVDSFLSQLHHENVESEIIRGEITMSNLKSTTKHLITRCGETLSRTRDKVATGWMRLTNPIAGTTPDVVTMQCNPPSSANLQRQVAAVTPTIGLKVMQCFKHVKSRLKQVGTGCAYRARELFSKWLGHCEQFGLGSIVGVARAAVIAGVVFGIGSVVVPVSDAQADTINYQSTVAGSISYDVTEPTGNAGEMEVSYTFEGIGTPRTEHLNVPLSIRVVEEESTARLNADFTIPENQTVNANVAGVVNSVRITLLGDTFKEGNEKIVLMLTLPPDVGGAGLDFKQFNGNSGGPEAKSIKLTFNITDDANDTEIDPIRPVQVANYQQGVLQYTQRGNDGVTQIVTVTEPAGDSETTDAHFNFRAVNSNQTNSENSSIPVSVSVVEGPTTAREGTDFVIPPNQTLDLSSAGTVNQITLQVKGDSFDEELERVIVIVTIPDVIPVHFQSSTSGGALRKSLRIRYDISDNSDDNGKGSEPNNRTITLESSSANGFLNGAIHYSVKIEPKPTSPVSVPIYARDAGRTDGDPNPSLTLPGTFDSQVPAPEPRAVQFITVGSSGTATGVIRVGNSGVTSPVTLTMHPSIKNYSFDPAGRSISIPLVSAPATAEISISEPTGTVNEGSEAEFTLTANNASRSADITIAVNVQDIATRTGADYVVDGTYYAVLKANRQTTTLSVPTIDNNAEGVDGLIMATLAAGAGYSIKSDANEAFANVLDTFGVTPSSVTVSASSTSVVEGGTATFTISRGSDQTGDLEVRYNLVDTGNVIDNEGTDLTATIPNNSTSVDVTLTFNTSTTDYNEANDGVELTLRSIREFAGARYRVGTESSVKIGVTNASLPVVSLSEIPDSVTQGHSFKFMISATGTLEATGLDVTVQFRDGGHGIVTGMTPGTFVANRDSTITIPQAGSQEVTITTTAIANTDNQDITITLAGTACNL